MNRVIMTVFWANNWYVNDVGGNVARIYQERDWSMETEQGKEQKGLKIFEEDSCGIFPRT